MGAVLRRAAVALLLLAFIFALVWGVTLWRWDSTRRLIETRDVVLYLFFLPVCAWLVLLLARWAWNSSAAKAASAATAGAAAATPAAAAPPSAAEQERAWSFALLWHGLHTSAAADAEGTAAALAGGRQRPQLDAALRDPDGLPVLSGRAEGVDGAVDAVKAEWAQLVLPAQLTAAQAARTQAASQDAQAPWLRAAALLQVQWLAALSQLDEVLPPPRSDAAVPTRIPRLAVRCGVPTHWPQGQRSLVEQWLLQSLKQRRAELAGVAAVTVQPLESGEELLSAGEQQLVMWRREQIDGLLLLLCADSTLDEQQLERWAAAQQLLSGPRTEGRVPGEAAAAVMLATGSWPAEAADKPPDKPHLQRMALMRRDKPADAAGRITSDVAERALSDCLKAAQLPNDKLAALVSDADLRPRTMRELTGALLPAAEHLQLGEDVLALGTACGELGIARPLCLLSLAAAQAVQLKQPVAALAVAPAHERLALLVLPDGKPVEAASSSSSSSSSASKAS
jgi:hypothetical protein